MKKTKRLLIYKILIIIFVCVIALLPDVSNRVPEIDLRVLVTVVGLDKTEKGIKTSAQIIIPMSEGEGKIKQEVISSEGRTVSEAFDMLSIAMGRKVELGHCGLIVIGRKLADDNVLPSLKHLLASGMMSAGVNLITTEDIEAEEFIDKANKLSEASSSGISNFISYSTEGAHIATLTLLKFLSDSHDASFASYMPCIEIGYKEPSDTMNKMGGAESQSKKSQEPSQADKKKNSEQQELDKSQSKQKKSGQDKSQTETKNSGGQDASNNAGGGNSGAGQEKSNENGGEEKKTEIKSVESLVMFEKGKRIKRLDKKETRGITWIDNKSDKGLVLVEDFEIEGHSLGAISGQLKRKNIKMDCGFKDGKPTVKFSMMATIILDNKYKIIEYWEQKRGENETLNIALQKSFSGKIIDDISAGIDSIKENNCDVMGIKMHFNRHRHKEYVKYNELKPNTFLDDVVVEYNVKCRVL